MQLARETGVRQQNLSRWLEQARNLPLVADKPKRAVPDWTVNGSRERADKLAVQVFRQETQASR
jgi:hypothetical protein